MGKRVGGHVRDRRIGWKFENHDNVLLHLIFKHKWTLWKETLLSRKEKRAEGNRRDNTISEEVRGENQAKSQEVFVHTGETMLPAHLLYEYKTTLANLFPEHNKRAKEKRYG